MPAPTIATATNRSGAGAREINTLADNVKNDSATPAPARTQSRAVRLDGSNDARCAAIVNTQPIVARRNGSTDTRRLETRASVAASAINSTLITSPASDSTNPNESINAPM